VTEQSERTSVQQIAHGLLLVLFVGVALAVGARVIQGYSHTLNQPYMNLDTALFAEMARMDLHGEPIYAARWDNKPPGIILFAEPFVALFGNTLSAINRAVVVNNVLFSAVVGALVYAVTRSRTAMVVGVLAAGLYSVINTKLETTILMSTFGVSALLCAVLARGRVWLLVFAGALFVAGCLTKQPLAVEFPLLLLVTWVAQPGRKRRALLALVSGMLAAVLVFVGWLLLNGTADAFIQRVIVEAYAYVLSPSNAWHFDARGQALVEDRLIPQTIPLYTPLLVAATVSAVSLVIARKTRWLVLGFVWLLLAIAGAFIARSLKIAYFMQAVPPLVLLIGLAVPVWRRWPALLQVGLLAVAVAGAYAFADRYVHPIEPVDDTVAQTAAFLEANRSGCLWSWGELNEIHFRAGYSSCLTMPLDQYTMETDMHNTTKYRAEYLRELLANPPALHVRTRRWVYFPELDNYAQRYLDEQLFSAGNYEVFSVDTSAFHPTYTNFNDEIALIGYDLAQTQYCAGDAIPLAMTWQRLATPAEWYQMFTKLLTPDETAELAGFDFVPADRPTYTWVDADEILFSDPFTLSLPPDIAPGVYPLVVGLYDPDTQVRLPVRGVSEGATYIRIAEIEIIEDGCGE
jgi:hypothetical protein